MNIINSNKLIRKHLVDLRYCHAFIANASLAIKYGISFWMALAFIVHRQNTSPSSFVSERLINALRRPPHHNMIKFILDENLPNKPLPSLTFNGNHVLRLLHFCVYFSFFLFVQSIDMQNYAAKESVSLFHIILVGCYFLSVRSRKRSPSLANVIVNVEQLPFKDFITVEHLKLPL